MRWTLGVLFLPELEEQPRRLKKLQLSQHQQKLKSRSRSLSKLADQDTKVNWLKDWCFHCRWNPFYVDNYYLLFCSDETEGPWNRTTIFAFPGMLVKSILTSDKLKYKCVQIIFIKLDASLKQRDLNISNKIALICVLIRSIIQKLLRELDPGTDSCLLMNSVSSPLIVGGSTCFLLRNHMKLLPLRSAISASLLFIVLFSISSQWLWYFPGSQQRNW